MIDTDILQRKLDRERKARKQAESILEKKALELYQANLELKQFNEALEIKVQSRSEALFRSEKKYREIMENMRLGLVEIDLEGNILKTNEVYQKMTGYSAEELLHKNVKTLVNFTAFDSALEDFKSLAQTSIELELIKKDGRFLWVLISGAPIYNESKKLVGRIGIHYDISEQKKLEKALIEAKEKAEQAQQAEQQFLANMSHEIRTPLNAIIGMSHLLESTKLDQEQQEYLHLILNGANLLQSLLSDILDISKIDAGKVTVVHDIFDLTEVLRRIKETFLFKAREKDLRIELSIDPLITHQINSDPLLLNQVLMNLMSNAEKFTESGSVHLSAKVLQKREEKMTIQFLVQDTGIGMSEEQLNRIFKRFQQANELISRDFGGTGLGLFISKKILQLLGSDIQVQSTLGKGSCFSFELETEVSNLPNKPPKGSQQSNALVATYKGKKVLITEDNSMNQRYITSLFKKWQVSFDLATNGLEALEYCQQKSYDLIFMDLQMPIMGGMEATEKIKTQSINQKTPIIALTASTFLSQKNKALESGMVDFISKPFVPFHLKKVLDRYLVQEDLALQTQAQAKLQSYSYHTELDVDFLQEAYGNDFESALELFEIFIETVPEQMSRLSIQNETSDNYHILHKVHPTFKMVGLSDLSDMAKSLHDVIADIPSIDIENRIKSILEKYHKDVLIIESEIIKLRTYVA